MTRTNSRSTARPPVGVHIVVSYLITKITPDMSNTNVKAGCLCARRISEGNAADKRTLRNVVQARFLSTTFGARVSQQRCKYCIRGIVHGAGCSSHADCVGAVTGLERCLTFPWEFHSLPYQPALPLWQASRHLSTSHSTAGLCLHP